GVDPLLESGRVGGDQEEVAAALDLCPGRGRDRGPGPGGAPLGADHDRAGVRGVAREYGDADRVGGDESGVGVPRRHPSGYVASPLLADLGEAEPGLGTEVEVIVASGAGE